MPRRLWLSVVVIWAVALAGASAQAADPAEEVRLTIENHRFSPEDLKVKAGVPFMLIITNKDGEAEEFEIRDLRIEKVIPARKTRRVKVPALKPGTYNFVGDYHQSTAKGRIVAE